MQPQNSRNTSLQLNSLIRSKLSLKDSSYKQVQLQGDKCLKGYVFLFPTATWEGTQENRLPSLSINVHSSSTPYLQYKFRCVKTVI